MGIKTYLNRFTNLDLLGKDQPLVPLQSNLAQAIVLQLRDFLFSGRLKFTISVSPAATSIPQKVRQVLQTFSAGSHISFGKLTFKLRSSTHAVGYVCRKYPIQIGILCSKSNHCMQAVVLDT